MIPTLGAQILLSYMYPFIRDTVLCDLIIVSVTSCCQMGLTMPGWQGL
jgi:hypothetical protein